MKANISRQEYKKIRDTQTYMQLGSIIGTVSALAYLANSGMKKETAIFLGGGAVLLGVSTFAWAGTLTQIKIEL
jgi:hypothetical protein